MNVRKILITGGSGFIGTNLIGRMLAEEYTLLNVDKCPPLNPDHQRIWRRQDILDRDGLFSIFSDFMPDAVIDLAARTDCDENTTVEEGYQGNITGAANVIEATKEFSSVLRVIFTSTQYVKRPGQLPKNAEDYDPHTVYGESKVRMERFIRLSNIPCAWTIIRPTNVWGPWHLRYRAQFLKILKMGLYFHPGGRCCTKSYAYVGNVAEQILAILSAPVAAVDRNIFYVGDEPIALIDWVNAFSREITGKNVKVVPKAVVHTLARAGDIISKVSGKSFPITTARYNSMTEDYLTPMKDTFKVLGRPRYSLDEGVKETLKWLTEFDRLQARTK